MYPTWHKISWIIFIGSSALLFNLNLANNDIQSDECSRFTVTEFYSSFFLPALKGRIAFLESILDKGCNDIVNTANGMEEAGTPVESISIEELLEGIADVRKESALNFQTFWKNIDGAFDKILNRTNTETGIFEGTSGEMKEGLEEVLKALATAEALGIRLPFEAMAEYMKRIVDPSLAVIEMMLNAKAMTKEQIFEGLKEKNILTGIILGELLESKLSGEPLPKSQYVGEFVGIITALMDKISEEETWNERDFWQLKLEDYWGLKQGLMGDEDETAIFIASIVSNVKLADSDDWKQKLLDSLSNLQVNPVTE